jgi:2',3'-cyclic-nucleotide 2'-phosphodiesterase (5'-nucleotidase family)
LPVDSSGTYTIATSDYLANGGDELELLKAYPQQKSTLLLRQALIDYIRMLTSNQKHITSIKDQRIINEP